MEWAMVDIRANEAVIAVQALEALQQGEDFQEDEFPGHLFLAQEHHELVHIEGAVWYVLCNHSAMDVYEDFSFGTNNPFSLAISIEGIAIHTSLDHVVFIFKQQLKFLHEQFAR